MRAALVLVALCAVAHAGNRVVVLTDRDDLPAALQVALASRHAEVAVHPTSPEGAERLDRAAAAQRVAMANNADAGIWIDADEVWVVLGDGRDVRHAPLPADATPRVFAAIATSLLDELFAPPEPAGYGVDVHVEITPPGATSSTPPTPSTPSITVAPSAVVAAPVLAPPATVAAVTTVDAAPVRAKNALLEFGPTLTNATWGIEAELLWPVMPSVKLGVSVGANMLYDGFSLLGSGTQMVDAGVELRHVGVGATHLDIGLGAGVARDSTDSDTGGFAALRLGIAHEYDKMALSVGIAPTLLYGFAGEGTSMTVLGSVHVVLPL